MDDKPQCYNNRNTYGITILFATQWHDDRQRIEKAVKTSQCIQQGRTSGPHNSDQAKNVCDNGSN